MSGVAVPGAPQDLVFHGVDWVLPLIPELVRKGRLEFGTNDIVLVMVMGEEGDEFESMSPFYARREDAIKALEGLFNESGHDATIERIRSAPNDPTHGMVVLIKGITVFSWRHLLDDLKTQSVIN